MEKNFEYVGTFWNSNDIELIKFNDTGRIFALYGWNGERYQHCWEVAENLIDNIDEDEEYIITPIYEQVDDEFEIVEYEFEYA